MNQGLYRALQATPLAASALELVAQLCEGSPSPLLLALVEGARFTPAEIDRFRRLLDQLETLPQPKPRKRK